MSLRIVMRLGEWGLRILSVMCLFDIVVGRGGINLTLVGRTEINLPPPVGGDDVAPETIRFNDQCQ